MADTVSTIILKVDLECRRCYKKISKTICKLQERESIQTITFDEKNNTVMVSGPFDPKKLSKKLCCKACNVIKDIQIKGNKEKEKEKRSEDVTKPSGSTEPKKDKAKESKSAESSEPKKDKPKESQQPKKDKMNALEPNPPAPEPVYVTQGNVFGYPPVWVSTGCGCHPERYYYGDCRFGRGYGWAVDGPPTVVYGAPAYGGYKNCDFFYEEDPQSSCNIM